MALQTTPEKKAIAKSIEKWLPLSRQRFDDEPVDRTFGFCRENYDSLVVGSDVVWNLRYTRRLRRIFGRGVFATQNDPFFPAFPNVYWPDQNTGCGLIAYAASCGNLNHQDVPRRDKLKMAQILDGYAGIGVRDSRTHQFVASLSDELGRRCRRVPDPTIAFDILKRQEDATELLEMDRKIASVDQPVALLIMKPGTISLELARILKRKGYCLIASGHFDGLADFDLQETGLSPIQWASLPRHATICVTERMHASIFCLLNGTNFLALDMNERFAGSATKIEDLLETFGLLNQYRHQADVRPDDMEKLIDQTVETEFDWSAVSAHIAEQRRYASEFLVAAGLVPPSSVSHHLVS